MVIDVEPVADVTAIAVQRHRLVINQVGHKQWNQFLREVVGSVVIATPCCHGVHAVGLVVAAHHQVAGRFAGGIGGIWQQGFVLIPGALIEGSVDFVSGHVDKPSNFGR